VSPSLILVLVPVLGFLGVGVYLLVATLKGRQPLDVPPVGLFYFFPYWFLLRQGGTRAVYYFHVAVGAAFILGALAILFFVTAKL
jgi:hypothetical protein